MLMQGFQRLFHGDACGFSDALSADDRRYGRALLRRFYTLNGISVACLMGNILILFAIRNGMTDSTVAVMASFVYLTMPFMLVGKPMIRRFGAARTRGLGWFFRYALGLVMVLAPLLSPVAPQRVITTLILFGAFGFAVFRSIGASAVKPLTGEVTETERPGDFLSTIQVRSHVTYLITMVLVMIAFRFLDELWMYQIVMGTGCIVGVYACAIVTCVPESSAPTRSAGKSLSESIGVIRREVLHRRLLFAWCAGLSAYAVVIPFMTIAVKNGYGISDFAALGLTMVLVLGSGASGFVNRKISDALGARRLLVLYILGLAGVALFWSRAPMGFHPVPVGLSFFTAGFCKIGIVIGLNQSFLKAVPNTDRVGSALVISITSGTAAGLAGSVIGGGLLEWLTALHLSGMGVYRLYFQLILAAVLAFLLVAQKLDPN